MSAAVKLKDIYSLEEKLWLTYTAYEKECLFFQMWVSIIAYALSPFIV